MHGKANATGPYSSLSFRSSLCCLQRQRVNSSIYLARQRASQPAAVAQQASQQQRAASQLAGQPAAAAASQQPASQSASRPAASRQPATSSTSSEPASQPASSRASQLVNSVVLRGVALLYESSGGNQVDGLPPVPTSYFSPRHWSGASPLFRNAHTGISASLHPASAN